jgi:hypothetical protein
VPDDIRPPHMNPRITAPSTNICWGDRELSTYVQRACVCLPYPYVPTCSCVYSVITCILSVRVCVYVSVSDWARMRHKELVLHPTSAASWAGEDESQRSGTRTSHIYVFRYIYACIQMYTCKLYIYIYIYIYIYMYTYTYSCIWTIYICIVVYIYVYICIHIYTSVYIYIPEYIQSPVECLTVIHNSNLQHDMRDPVCTNTPRILGFVLLDTLCVQTTPRALQPWLAVIGSVEKATWTTPPWTFVHSAL